MKKKSLLVTILLLLIAVFAFSLTACNKKVDILESLQNEYGSYPDGEINVTGIDALSEDFEDGI